MDECYGKQIDYYNQLPNSSRAIEDILKRLEKAESQNEKFKNHLFYSMEDFELCDCDCDVEWIKYYSDGEASAGGVWENVKLTFKIDKEKNQIMIDIYEKFKYEWVIDPNDPHYYKLRDPFRRDENVKKITYEYDKESDLSTPAILDINDCNSTMSSTFPEGWGPVPEVSPKYYWLTFDNKADWEKRRNREISYIQIPEKTNLCNNFKILLELINQR